MSIINVHAPSNEKDEEIKIQYYEELEDLYSKVPNYDIKIVIWDFNGKVGKEHI